MSSQANFPYRSKNCTSLWLIIVHPKRLCQQCHICCTPAMPFPALAGSQYRLHRPELLQLPAHIGPQHTASTVATCGTPQSTCNALMVTPLCTPQTAFEWRCEGLVNPHCWRLHAAWCACVVLSRQSSDSTVQPAAGRSVHCSAALSYQASAVVTDTAHLIIPCQASSVKRSLSTSSCSDACSSLLGRWLLGRRCCTCCTYRCSTVAV